MITTATASDWISAMATRLAHLKDASEAAVWEAIPPLFLEAYGAPCDRNNAYHIAIAAAVVRALQGDADRA